MLVKKHPTLGVAVREDGAVMVKGAGSSRTYHWSFGAPRGRYMRVTIGSRSYNVHVIVAEAFIGPRPDGMQVDHIDRDGTNNHGFWESHAYMRFSDGSRHIVPMNVASELREVPVSQRFFTRR